MSWFTIALLRLSYPLFYTIYNSRNIDSPMMPTDYYAQPKRINITGCYIQVLARYTYIYVEWSEHEHWASQQRYSDIAACICDLLCILYHTLQTHKSEGMVMTPDWLLIVAGLYSLFPFSAGNIEESGILYSNPNPSATNSLSFSLLIFPRFPS